ncbi:MAG: HEAT repeat domain-containing protein, partial [Bryobacteraceae bacterium]
VNFYLPGYVESGLFRGLIKKTFSGDDNRVVPLFVNVRKDVVLALGGLVKSGSSMDSRANAARAVGVLRGSAALPALIDGLHSKNDEVIYESLIAIQKIRDPDAAPSISFLLGDLKEKVQIAAIETTGLLLNKEAIPNLSRVYENTRSKKVRKAAITALAMLPDESTRPIYQKAFQEKDEEIRAAAAEGYARLKNPSDKAMLEKAFAEEQKMKPRLALAFALVSLDNSAMTEFAPLRYLVNTLNSRLYTGIAEAYLRELVRTEEVRNAIYPALQSGTKPEKMALGRVLAVSGDESSLAHLETLSKDPDTDVAEQGLRSLRSLKARIR